MTFDDIVSRISKKTGLTSSTAITRIGETVNDVYKEVTSSIGLNVSRHFEAQANASIGSQLITFSGVEKVNQVIDKSSGGNRVLDEVSLTELDSVAAVSGDLPSKYAIYRMNAGTVQIKINSVPQTAFTLYAPGFERASMLSGSQEPAFPESFHDVIYWAGLYEELLKQEKLALAKETQGKFTDRMGDLRIFIAKSPNQDIYVGKMSGTTINASVMSGGGGSGTNGAASYTQTGLITFDRSGAGAGSAPFAVVSGAGKVANLDADKLDGFDWSTVGVLPDGGLGLTDVTTNNVTSTKHGFAPKSPADATKFLNGAATPAYAQVKDSDLSTSDVVTNNVSSTKHGFAPKSPASATQFLNGAATPAFAAVKDSDLALTDITTNNVSTAAHGFITKAPNDTAQFFRGDASWAVAFPQLTQGRLTLTTGVPVTTADVTGATSVFFTPYGGNRIAVYTSSQWKLYTFTELTLALGTLTNDLPYDVFIFDSAGTLTLEAVAWTSKTARATALVSQDGVYVKSGSTNKKYLGTFHTTATTTTEDSFAKRLLWNYYNRVRRVMRVVEATDSWSYTTATFRQARATAANQLAFVQGVADAAIVAEVAASFINSTGLATAAVSIGEDSTTTPVAGVLMTPQSSNTTAQIITTRASLVRVPAEGYHTWVWLEFSTAAGTTNWQGDGGVAYLQSGISGFMES